MTKIECEKCEKLMNQAIMEMERLDEYWDEYEKAKKDNRMADAEVAMRQFDYKRGYANGIYDVLATINFKHERMKELCELIR